ncbi:MAG: amino acid adenylation domain-containing protein, partial [Microbacterium gubbeenense]
GQDDIIVGTAVANRNHAGLDALIGNFGNTLPLRISARPGQTFATLIDAVAGTVARALSHQGYPFDLITNDLAPHNHREDRGLIDAMMVFLTQDIEGPQLPGSTTSWHLYSGGQAEFPLSAEVFALPHRLDVKVTYQTGIFEAETIDRIIDGVEEILETAELTDALAALVGLKGESREGARGPEYPSTGATLDSLMRSQTRTSPEAYAVIGDGENAFTYAQLDARANALALLLADSGVGVGDRVGVILPRTSELVVALAGIVRSGAAYVPMMPDYPTERIRQLVQDAVPRVVIADAATANAHRAPLVESGTVVIEIDSAEVQCLLDEGAAQGPGLSRPIVPADAAYVIFTSGTTGRPKGVEVSHAAVANRLWWMREDYGITASDRVLLKTPVTFDVSVWEFFLPLTTGATMVVAKDAGHKDPEYLADVIARQRITVVHFVPSMLHAFIAADPAVQDVASLRRVFFSGEALPARSAIAASKLFAAAELHNLYGPTEAAVDVTAHPVRASELVEAQSVPIGTPVTNTVVRVLDGWLRPTPTGSVGELYLGGVQLANGYAGRQALTAERFVADPIGRRGERLYRTGDLVRWNVHGELEFLGRSDDQVKIRGQRIELDEIRAVLERHPAIASAAVTTHENRAGATQIAAYVTTTEAANVADRELAETLRRDIARTLPDFMIPASITRLDAFPVTPNGKLDRRALPDPDPQLQTEGGRAPETPTEQGLARVFREVLSLPSDVPLLAGDDFFRLGGDSILSIQVVTRARRAGMPVTTEDVFTARTISALAARAESAESTSRHTAIPDAADSSLWPIAAQRINDPGFETLAQSFMFVTPGELSEEQLFSIVQRTMAHHPELHARLVRAADGRSWAFSLPAGSPDLAAARIVSERAQSAWSDEKWAQLSRTKTEELARTLAPREGIMWRAAWFSGEGKENGRLLVVIHHLVIDGVSWRILRDDLEQSWEIETGRKLGPLAETGTRLTAWSRELASRAEDDDIVAHTGYWAETVSSDEPLMGTRPLDPATDTYATAGRIELILSNEVSRAVLSDIPGALSAEVNDVLIGALTLAVREWRTRRDANDTRILLGLEGHGREESLVPGADLSRTVGWFTSWFPVALTTDRVAGGDTVNDGDAAARTVLAVKEQLRLVPTRGVSYGLLRYLNDTASRALAEGAKPQVTFNYLGQFHLGTVGEHAEATPWQGAPELPEIGGHASEATPLPAAIDLNIAAIQSGSETELRGTITFATGIVDRAEVQELADLWTDALSSLTHYARRAEGTRRSPADLTARGISQTDVDDWEAQYGELADVLPLTPLQQGLVFESLLLTDRDAIDVYVVQNTMHLVGDIDPLRLERAFEQLLERFPNLRSVISATDEGRHVAVIPSTLPLRLEVERLADSADMDDALERIADRDRATPFALSEGPLLRATLARHRTGDALILTIHHVLADGWSMPRIIHEVFEAYNLPEQKRDIDDTYTRFVDWLAERDSAASIAQWRRALDVIESPTLLTAETDSLAQQPHIVEIPLDGDLMGMLAEPARAASTTLSGALQTAWSLFLHLETGNAGVVFGTTVSGRPPEVEGIEDAVGLFINTVPTPISLVGDPTVGELMERTHRSAATLLEHHHTPLAELHRISGLNPLFDTLFVYENYPFDEDQFTRQPPPGGIGLREIRPRDSTHYPLVLVIRPGTEAELLLAYRPDRFDTATIERHRRTLAHIVALLSNHSSLRVRTFLALVEAARHAQETRTTAPSNAPKEWRALPYLDAHDAPLWRAAAEHLSLVATGSPGTWSVSVLPDDGKAELSGRGDTLDAVATALPDIVAAYRSGMPFTVELTGSASTVNDTEDEITEPLRIAVRRAARVELAPEEEHDLRERYGNDAEILPLSPLQRGLLYHLVRARESDDHDTYTSQATRELAGSVDAERMRDAVEIAVSRYPNLRAAFLPSGQAQVIPANVTVPVRTIGLREWLELSTNPTEFLRAERRTPFDFENPPLIRFVLFEHAHDQWTLAMSFAHILLDGWSFNALFTEILEIYADPGY